MSKKRSTWLLLLLAILALSTILLVACARPGSPTANTGQGAPSSSGNTGGGPPTVHMGSTNFVQSSVDVPKGSMLMLVDDMPVLHILANGSWQNGVAKPAKEPGAPTVNNLQVNGNTVEIGPFATAGTYHIYCTIHPNMNLTIAVK